MVSNAWRTEPPQSVQTCCVVTVMVGLPSGGLVGDSLTSLVSHTVTTMSRQNTLEIPKTTRIAG